VQELFAFRWANRSHPPPPCQGFVLPGPTGRSIFPQGRGA
jgi:hypothetical protein